MTFYRPQSVRKIVTLIKINMKMIKILCTGVFEANIHDRSVGEQVEMASIISVVGSLKYYQLFSEREIVLRRLLLNDLGVILLSMLKEMSQKLRQFN